MAAPRKTTSSKLETASAPETPSAEAGTEPTAASAAELYGQTVNRGDTGRPFVASNRFSAAHVEVRGRELLALAPTSNVGPAPILVPMTELDELIADLVALREAPGPYDEGPEA